jgi:hypothetical protein
MADLSAVRPAPSRQHLRHAVKRAGIAILFLFVLIIPALRRLRRRMWLWTVIRATAVAAGGWLIQGFIYAAEGAGALALGIVLVLFGLAFRARPQVPTLDNLAQELRALVVVNGGSLIAADGVKLISNIHLLVNSDRVLASSRLRPPVVEIPFSSIKNLTVQRVVLAGNEGQSIWDLEITWQSQAVTTTRFRYRGVFAEHLAGVAEITLRNLWKKQLPILPAG